MTEDTRHAAADETRVGQRRPNGRTPRTRPAYHTRTWGWSLGVAAGVVVLVLTLASLERLPLLENTDDQWVPFALTLAGVALYALSQTRTRRERFDPRYLPDYAYRAAQAVVYLYVILGILAQRTVGETGYADFTDWPPNLLGLLVGLYIQHVEKAMEGLGQRFEEALTALLARPLTAKTSREKDREVLAVNQRFETVKTQAEALTAITRDPGLATGLQEQIARVQRIMREKDADAMSDAVDELVATFELAKRAQREELVLAHTARTLVHGSGSADGDV